MRTLVLALIAALLAGLGVFAPASAPDAFATVNPKVAIIVGATHSATATYRSYADQLYAEAIKYTTNVVKVYSPNATWSKVKSAVNGASIVVYLGHGNGWPSPYTYDPTFSTKDGFGLNYDLNGDGKLSDYENKYYGEPKIATLTPAPNAMVLLFHLCYASGNSEPDRSDPSPSVAQQRVDNYASAFLRAGAGAVIADGHSHDPYYIRALFTTNDTIDEYWRNAPDYHGNATAYISARTTGATFQLDPESPGKYYRSVAGNVSQDVTCAFELKRTSACPGPNADGLAGAEWPGATTYVPVEPTRLLDSRVGNGLTGKFQAKVGREFQVAGRGPVPADAVAVTGNFTVTRQTAGGYGSLTPEATNSPTTSTINFPVGISAANNVTVALGPGGKLGAVYRAGSGATTDFVFDVTGYFLADDSGATYDPVEPVRLLDTRADNGLDGPFTSRDPRTWQITGREGIPADATAITGNLTVAGQTGNGYVAVGPDATASPTTSTINIRVGDTRANGLTVKLGAPGTLSAVYVSDSNRTTQLVLDVTGYYTANSSGARFYPLAPDRVLDSRDGTGLDGVFKAATARTLTIGSQVGVPADAAAVTGNLTVVGQTKAGYAAMTQLTTSNPTTSTLNFPVGQTRANGVTGPLSPSGTVGLVYKAGAGATTDLVLDITGYFQLPGDGGSTSGAPASG